MHAHGHVCFRSSLFISTAVSRTLIVLSVAHEKKDRTCINQTAGSAGSAFFSRFLFNAPVMPFLRYHPSVPYLVTTVVASAFDECGTYNLLHHATIVLTFFQHRACFFIQVHLQDPITLNPLSNPLILTHELFRSGVGVIILAGEGTLAFCSGGDQRVSYVYLFKVRANGTVGII